MSKAKPTRRELLRSALSVGVVIAIDGCKERTRPMSLDKRSVPPTVPVGLKFFTAANYAAAIALFERLFPADDDPGATDLNVAYYVDTALVGPYAEYQGIMRLGLARLDVEAGSSFFQIPPTRQDEVLRAFEKSDDGNAFIQVATTLVIEAAFTDPIHRQSTNAGGWKVIGFVPDQCARPDSRGKK